MSFLDLLILGWVDLGEEEVDLLESRAGQGYALRNPSTKTHIQNVYASQKVQIGET